MLGTTSVRDQALVGDALPDLAIARESNGIEIYRNAGSGSFEQAGLWFGLNEDNYLKVVVVSTGTNTVKVQALREMHRVLAPGGRIGISDVVAEDHVTPAERAERGSFVGCVAGALSRREYLEGLAAAGFEDASVEFTHEVVPGMHGAIVRATKPTS